MTVKELLNALSTMPQDAEVILCPVDFVPVEIERVSLITVDEKDMLSRICKIDEQVVTLSDF